MADIPRVDYNRLRITASLGSGGQGKVSAIDKFPVNGFPVNGGYADVLKIYVPGTLEKVDTTALEKIVGFPRALTRSDSRWLHENTAWPVVIVEDRSRVCGFLMRRVLEDYRFDYHTQTLGSQQKLASMEFLLNSDQYVRNSGLQVTELNRVALLRSLAVILSRLHSLDVAVGDLSPKNLLFKLRPAPGCFLIDCDSMQVRGASAVKQVETPDWEVPAGESRATPEADAYKFALLAIRMFERDQSSTDRAALRALSAPLDDLAAASLNRGSSRRPSVEAWIPALDAAASAITAPPRRPSQPLGTIPLSPAPPAPVPTYPQPPPVRRRSGARTFGKFVTVVMLLLAIAAAGLHFGPRVITFIKDDTAAGQAAQINNLLNASASTRKALDTADKDISDCISISSAATAMSKVAEQREQEYARAEALATGKLANGAALKSDLVKAMHYSAIADKYYVSWAHKQKKSRCAWSASVAHSYNAGLAESRKAVAAKDAFAKLWNPIAAHQGFPARSEKGM